MVIVISDMIKKGNTLSPQKRILSHSIQQMKSSLIRPANIKKRNSLQSLKQKQKWVNSPQQGLAVSCLSAWLKAALKVKVHYN